MNMFDLILMCFVFPFMCIVWYISYKFAIKNYPYDENGQKTSKILKTYYEIQKTTSLQKESRENWEKSMKMYSDFSLKLFKIFLPISCLLFIIGLIIANQHKKFYVAIMILYNAVCFIITMINCYKAQYKL